uniref:VP n=1 Tax=uncultured densovirus TaxID=748192 RepID=A0A7L7YTH7_9VIRU|nr:VP [uncultured densovirus]
MANKRKKPLRHPLKNEGYNDMSRSWQNYTWAQYNQARFNRGLVQVWPEYLAEGRGVTNRPPSWRKIPANYPRITNREYMSRQNYYDSGVRDVHAPNAFDSGPLMAAFDKTPVPSEHGKHNDPELSAVVESGVLDELANVNQPPVSSAGVNSPDTIERLIDESDQQVAGPSRTTESTRSPTTNKARTIMPNKRARQEPAPAAPEAVHLTGSKTPADGGFDSSQGPESTIRKGSYGHSGGHRSFTKVHHLKSFAIPFTTIVDAGVKNIVTPMLDIPWNRYLCYMSQAELDLIPDGSHAVDCHISVQHIVTSTSHPVGGTTATIATFNHPKIGIIGYDLEKKCRGGTTKLVTMSSTKEVSPISVAKDSLDAFKKLQYGTDQSSPTWDGDDLPGVAFPIPIHTYRYFCLNQPSRASMYDKDNNPTGLRWDATNSPGYENFNHCIEMFNLNDVTWDTVAEQSYSFKHAHIGKYFPALEVVSGNVTQVLGSADQYVLERQIGGIRPGAALTNTPNFKQASTVFLDETRVVERIIETAGGSYRNTFQENPARQPSFHIGMLPIPKLSSLTNGNRSDENVHAEAYYVVTATLNIKCADGPNRFTLPKDYTVNVENAWVGTNDTVDPTKPVTFGLYTQ